VLRLWRDRVRIVLCPDRVITVHCKGGLRPHIVAKQVHRYSGSEPGWQAALPVLQTALENPDWRNADATLIISNHFVRFLLLPWNDVSLNDAEKLSLLQHRFAEVYGEASATWEMRLSEGTFGSPSLASAVDLRLLEQLKGIFNASPLRLKSIQPYLMTAFNVCRRELGKEAAWFVLAEQGVFCVGSLDQGQWQSIRLRQTGNNDLTERDWFDEAMLVLEREMLLADKEINSSKVFVYAPEVPELPTIKRGLLAIHPLRPDTYANLSPGEMNIYAMAVAGM
jgi:hypothetical protein